MVNNSIDINFFHNSVFLSVYKIVSYAKVVIIFVFANYFEKFMQVICIYLNEK